MNDDLRIKRWLIRDKYGGDRSALLTDDLARIEGGEPLDYVIGWSDFLGCRIGLSSRPLIPRAETEYWTKRVIEQIGDKRVRVLDVFAGSGCIGVAVLKYCPNARVHFAEINERHAEQIKKNCHTASIDPSRYRIFVSDIFSGVSEDKYDLILANPPYIPAGRELDESVAAYEPAEALFAGPDGLALIGPFLDQAKDHLLSKGEIWLEFDTEQKDRLTELIAAAGFSGVWHDDQFARPRFAVISNL